MREQTREWGQLMQRHMTAEFELRKEHIHQQLDLLKRLLSEMQLHQMDELKEKHDLYGLEMLPIFF